MAACAGVQPGTVAIASAGSHATTRLDRALMTSPWVGGRDRAASSGASIGYRTPLQRGLQEQEAHGHERKQVQHEVEHGPLPRRRRDDHGVRLAGSRGPREPEAHRPWLLAVERNSGHEALRALAGL